MALLTTDREELNKSEIMCKILLSELALTYVRATINMYRRHIHNFQCVTKVGTAVPPIGYHSFTTNISDKMA